MMYLVQRIDEYGIVWDDDVSGFPMSHEGAETLRRYLTDRIDIDGRYDRKYTSYIVVPTCTRLVSVVSD